jgi:hypothetical protein
MMRGMRMLLAAGALAACSRAEPAADRQVEDAPAAPSESVAKSAEAARTGGAGDTVRIHPTLPPHGFALHESQPGVVDSIVVTAGGARVQTLRTADNLLPPEAAAEVERLSTLDLDWDGYADLALLSEVAMANSRSQYWRFDPATRRFTEAGEFETLVPDSAAREHTTFNRGGHGGRLWTAARWRWAENRLVPVVEEEQESVDADRRYVHVVRRRRGDRMEVVRADTLEGDAELHAGPSWMER